MKNIVYSILTASLLYCSQVFAMSVNDSAISGDNSTSNGGQDQTNSDQNTDNTARKSSDYPWEATYKKPEIKLKDPKNYSKTDH